MKGFPLFLCLCLQGGWGARTVDLLASLLVRLVSGSSQRDIFCRWITRFFFPLVSSCRKKEHLCIYIPWNFSTITHSLHIHLPIDTASCPSVKLDFIADRLFIWWSSSDWLSMRGTTTLNLGACVGLKETLAANRLPGQHSDRHMINEYVGKSFFEDENYRAALERLDGGRFAFFDALCCLS